MELYAIALQEEDQEEREERLGLVHHAWPLTCACFQSQLESSDAPDYTSVALARQ